MRWAPDIRKNAERIIDVLSEQDRNEVRAQEHYQTMMNRDLNSGYLEGIKTAAVPYPEKLSPDLKLKENDGSYGLLGPLPYRLKSNSEGFREYMRRPIQVETSFLYPPDVVQKYEEEHPEPTTTPKPRKYRKFKHKKGKAKITYQRKIPGTKIQFQRGKPLTLQEFLAHSN